MIPKKCRPADGQEPITIYGIPGDPGTYITAERLVRRRLAPKIKVVGDSRALAALPVLSKMIAKGLASETKVALPIIEFANGEGVTAGQFESALQRMPLVAAPVSKRVRS